MRAYRASVRASLRKLFIVCTVSYQEFMRIIVITDFVDESFQIAVKLYHDIRDVISYNYYYILENVIATEIDRFQ